MLFPDELIPDFFVPIAKLLLAAVLSSTVGVEREARHKPAGLRTYMLVCIGACLITLVSLSSFPNDSARIASGIITGIGFLGAGAIIAHGNHVKGLTTAASLWVMAAVGLSIGSGEYLLAIVTTFIIYFILRLKEFE